MSEDIITNEVSEETESKDVVETTPKYTQEEDAKYIQKLKKENEKYRKDYEKKLGDEKEAKKTALEEQGKYKELYETTLKDVETSKKNLSDVEKKNALRLALRDAKAKHPELLEGLFKSGNDWTFELDENGKIKDIDSVLNPIKEKYSDGFGEVVKKGFDPKKGSGGDDFFSQEQMNNMSDAELVANYEKVEKSMQQL